MSTEFSPFSPKKFVCTVCSVSCAKKTEWTRHINTKKHKINEIGETINQTYACRCGKKYKERSGLWRHSKSCKDDSKTLMEDSSCNKNDTIVELLLQENIEFKNLVLEVVKSNTELQKQTNEMQQQMIELYKQKDKSVHNSNNTINSHNKNFNLQFFLNEQCKDAMNIMDFVNTFQLQLSDLERIGEVGYVEGISNIVIDKLNQMDVYKRPIHCSDAKREIMHVKDKDVWEKEKAANDKIRLALKHITKKNTDLLRPWVNAHPGVLDSDHRLNDKYQLLFIEAMGGNKNKTMREGEDKIIKKISKMVLIDKGMA